jgi:hypothetical protein
MIHFTVAGKGIAAAVALLILPFQEIHDVLHGSIHALLDQQLIDNLVHQTWH